MTISKKSTLLSCVIITAVLVFLAESYTSITAKTTLTSGGLAIAAALIYMCFIRFYILKPLKEFSRALENIPSDGADLTQRLKSEGDDEIGRIAKTFNTSMDNIAKAVAEAQNAAAAITRAASEAALNMNAYYKGVKEMSDKVKSFSSNIAAQERGVEGFKEISAELLKDCYYLSTQISEAADAIDKITISKENGERKLSVLAEDNSAGTGKNKTADGISVLDSQITCAAQIAGEIKNAAEQTRLLSLSARTEAASAGEHGIGFAAVSEAVTTLAGHTADSALKIEKIIASMSPISAETVIDALKTSEGQDVYVEEMARIFPAISSEIDAVNSVFGNVHKSLSAVTSINVKIRECTRIIHEIGLENRRNAESVEEAMKQQVNSIKNVIDLSYGAASSMQELKGALNRLKADAGEPGM